MTLAITCRHASGQEDSSNRAYRHAAPGVVKGDLHAGRQHCMPSALLQHAASSHLLMVIAACSGDISAGALAQRGAKVHGRVLPGLYCAEHELTVNMQGCALQERHPAMAAEAGLSSC